MDKKEEEIKTEVNEIDDLIVFLNKIKEGGLDLTEVAGELLKMENALNMYMALTRSGRILAAEVAKATKINNYGKMKKQMKVVLTAYLAANQHIADGYKDALDLNANKQATVSGAEDDSKGE